MYTAAFQSITARTSDSNFLVPGVPKNNELYKNNDNESSYSIRSSGVIAINDGSANSTPADLGELSNLFLFILLKSDIAEGVYNNFRNENDMNC